MISGVLDKRTESVFDIARVHTFIWHFGADEGEMTISTLGEKIKCRLDQLGIVERDLMNLLPVIVKMNVYPNAVVRSAQTWKAALEVSERRVFGENGGIGVPVHAKLTAPAIESGGRGIECAHIPFDGQLGIIAQKSGQPFAVGFVVLAEQKEDSHGETIF